MVEGNKQVRVDNWGTFFLQRLQVFFAKTDYCDLTLQFNGNVQLKVHRLVMNACTEYFKFLEETCHTLEENTIVMPEDLQSDVIVPIVNFMYTGMLEFHVSLFDNLYKAAELMNITILTKLLDAQKITQKSSKPKQEPIKRQTPIRHQSFTPDLPSPLPGRKVPVWKRKTVPSVSTPIHASHSASQSSAYDQHWPTSDPLADNTPKPTRFEWPEDDLPNMTLLDTSFEDISYTSRPLLTKEEEEKIKPSFDDLRNNVELPKKSSAKSTNNAVNFKEIEEFAKEQKIRNAMFEDFDDHNDSSQKRKADTLAQVKASAKKIKISNKENKETTISVESNTLGDIDHTKIVTEILKKYPDLVKKNKNIKLKIMPGKESGDKKIVNAVVEQVKRPTQTDTGIKSKTQVIKQIVTTKRKPKAVNDLDEEGPWVCRKCIAVGGEVQEFVLYYLYRKHMTDVHDEVFDTRLCKYCGRKCNNHSLMLYHMYTKHALKPPVSYNFPKCDKCPYIALSTIRLQKHRLIHDDNEMQCQDCKLAFSSPQSLTAHIRITGHYNKPGRVSYDCQYCMKKLQSGITLFSHIKKSHMTEGKRDGIVCLDELDAMEELEDDEDMDGEGEEYILPEVLNENSLQKDKVKIISNVKVPPNQQHADSTQQSRMVSLEPSSEAEALNNVASGIATSLNLVDIVVLDENQQYILQQDGQNEQEFIIPELAHGQPFAGQVITTQDNSVIQQGMIQSSAGDIASTDELVMVLTDHDYPDEHEGENPENSNIVVLYSHPVEGQEGQFITSQGNLMVNSQTGMLEIRNGPTIATTTASQMVVTNSVDTPIESIEMIQREIDSHASELKQEPFFEEEKSEEPQEQPITKLQSMPDIQDIPEVENSQAPEESEPEEPIPIQVPSQVSEVTEVHEEPHTQQNEEPAEASSEQHEEKDTSEDNIDGSLDVSAEEQEQMEVEDIEPKIADNDEREEISNQEQPQEQESEETETPTQDPLTKDDENDEKRLDEEGVDVPPDATPENPSDVPTPPAMPDNPSFMDSVDEQLPLIESSPSLQEPISEENHEVEPMEVDGKIPQGEQTTVQEEKHVESNEVENDDGEGECGMEEGENAVGGENSREGENGAEEGENGMEEGEESQETENITTQDEMEDSNQEKQGEELRPEENEKIKNFSSEELSIQKLATNSTDINRTILDDWADDTDSQQSEKNVTDSESQVNNSDPSNKDSGVGVASAVENVNKLMDDWDEEDEEEKKE